MWRFVIPFIFLSIQVWAQSGNGKQVLNRIQEKKWTKAEQAIVKVLQKDTTDAEIKYVASILFSDKNYPKYNLDSAHHYLHSSQQSFFRLPLRERERLKKLPLDSSLFLKQKEQIDSLAFEAAKLFNTEEAYIYFLNHFHNTRYTTSATELRDEIAFITALKTNSQKSYAEFFRKYPSSNRANEARGRYEKILFDEHTQDGRLKSFQSFINKYPTNPYRLQAERYVFEISTAGGTTESFRHFIESYPQSKWITQAHNLLFHLQDHYTPSPDQSVSDSLKKIIELDKSYWVPFTKSGHYGFMNASGTEKIAPNYKDIFPDYLCGNIQLDYLITSEGIIARNEKMLYKGIVHEVKDLGSGFLKIRTNASQLLLHKSGFTIKREGMNDARVLANRFLLIKKESGWGILSFSNRDLVPFIYEDISSFDDWIVLTKNKKKIIVTADQIGAVADRKPLHQNMVFDDVNQWADGQCWVRNDALEGVLNESLEFIIPLDRQVLSKTPFGFLRKKENDLFIEGIRDLQNTSYNKVTIRGQWLLTQQKNNQLQLYEIQSGKKITDKIDSIWFEQNIALVKCKDSIRAWLNRNIYLDFNKKTKDNLISKDSSVWIYIEEKNKKAVYDALSGERLFAAEFDKIENPATNVFLISKANKKGLIDINGKVLLPIEYDAIIQSESGKFSLLKDKKFGLYDLASKKLIKPAYDRNVVQYNNHWLIAFKEGGWSFIQPDTKPANKFQYSEIKYWNDTTAWIKENFHWKLVEIKSGEILMDKIKDFSYVKKYAHEHVVIIHQDNYYGVISNRHGIIIPPTFTDIINLGDTETPLYFTEKHVEEADMHIVIYYDNNGKLLRKQAFESDEYERILCEEN
jgi:WG containing repeat